MIMKAQLLTIISLVLLSGTLVMAQQFEIQNYRPVSKDGVNIFEGLNQDNIQFDGLKVRLGGAFSQRYQMLNHTNAYTAANLNNSDPDKMMMLVPIKNGFNLAEANLNIDVQLDDGVRLEMITYLSARHHNEAWVKGGYIRFDKLPFLNSEAIDKLMDKMTIKIGHMEVNYGDGHFRRTDNGNAIFNPFVGNYIMDAFNTEVGGEVYFHTGGFLAMAALTEGEIKGDVKGTNEGMNPAFYGKMGFDKQINEDLRLRLTGSYYTTNDQVATNHIFDGDRSGSSYFYAVEPQQFNHWQTGLTSTTPVNKPNSGRWSPGFSNKVSTFQLNPFVKFQGLEFFGIYEVAKGGKYGNAFNPADGTPDNFNARKVNQISGEVIYRFLQNEQLFVGARYNKLSGELENGITDANIVRTSLAAGWYLGKNVLAKLEYVKQNYNDFAPGTFYEDGQFDGLMIEAVIGF
jgi:hypothetical protein